MKTNIYSIVVALVIAVILVFPQNLHAQNTFPSTGAAGIGTPSPNASSLLEIKSTTKGMLIPRMTKAQRDAITTPATGLLIYQTNNTPGFYYYSGTGWTAVSTKGANQSLSNLSTTSINTPLLVSTGDTFDLGSSSKKWRTLYVDGISINGAANLSSYNSNLYYGGGGFGTGQLNTGLGLATLSNLTTGFYNTAVGDQSLFSATSGNYNVGVGTYSLYANNTGYNNIAIGAYSLYTNTYAGDLVAIGSSALFNNGAGASQSYDGTANTAIGTSGLYSNTIGYNNTATGFQALFNNTNGYNNTAYGVQSLLTNASGIGNTAVGVAADVTTSGLIGAMAIGYYAKTNASNKIVIGTASNNNNTGGYGTWQSFSDGRFKDNINDNVPGLSFINKLHPVTYHLNAAKIDEFLGIRQRMDTIKNAEEKARYNERLKIVSSQLQTGFIAQEVEATAKSIGYNFDGVHHPSTDKDNYTIGYASFVVPLVKAVQELSKENDSLKNKTTMQEKINADLQNQINELKAMIVSNRSTVDGQPLTVLSFASLEQNIPNPFLHSTTIGYTLPQKFTSSQIIITDKNGKTLKQINISGNGKGSLNVDASTLAAGAYQYSLMVDGRLIDTKQMEHLK